MSCLSHSQSEDSVKSANLALKESTWSFSILVLRFSLLSRRKTFWSYSWFNLTGLKISALFSYIIEYKNCCCCSVTKHSFYQPDVTEVMICVSKTLAQTPSLYSLGVCVCVWGGHSQLKQSCHALSGVTQWLTCFSEAQWFISVES